MKLKIHLFILPVFLSFAFSGYSQHYQDTINAARNASNQGQYKKALKYYKSAERITPKEVDLSQEMGQTAYKAGDFETAERCFDDLAAKSKTSKQRSTHITDSGISSMKAESYAAAEEKFKEAMRNDPSNEKARQLYMEAKRLRKQQEEAEKDKDKEKEDQEDEGKDKKDQNDPKDPGEKDGQNQKKQNNENKNKKSSKGDSQGQSNGQPQEGTLEDKQTERKLDELSRQEMDAKRRMNGTNGSHPGKKTTKDW
jgi:tetratricopeptide (TPR) repeat protein